MKLELQILLKKRKLFAIDLKSNKILSDCNQYDNLKFDTTYYYIKPEADYKPLTNQISIC